MKYLLLTTVCLTQIAAEDFQRGYGPLPEKAPSAFNASAEVHVKQNGELFTSASFLYWLAEEEGLDLAISAALVEDTVTLPPVSKTLFQNVEFRPGFKVGLGIDTHHDDWLAGLEYTYFHQTTHTSSEAKDQPYGVGVWFLSNWFIQANPGTEQTIAATAIESKWNLQMDLLDGYLSRSFYQGRFLTLDPFVGLRAAWIRQSLTIHAADPQAPTPWVTSHNQSRSWAIGPRLGLKGQWLLGQGFRLESALAASVLYTRYPLVKHQEDAISSNTIPVVAEFKNYGCLRSIAECGLGVGWGTYFNRDRMAIDLLASYDFSIYWNQNLIRRVVDLNTLQEFASPANLYLQGLCVTLRLDY